MRTYARMIFSGVCLVALAAGVHGRTGVSNVPSVAAGQKAAIVETYGKLPLAFEANQGQTDSQVKFLSRGAGYSLFLTPTEAALSLKPSASSSQSSASAVLRMKLLDSNVNAQVTGQDQLLGKSNYFIGNDPKQWHTNVPQFANVRYANVYPGVDLVFYGDQRDLEYDFVLQPGTKPEAIRLGIEGASRIRLERGDLVLTSAAGDVRLRSPKVYQNVSGGRHDVRSEYVMTGKNEVGFRVSGYDRTRALVIDPTLAYSTYLGGSGDDVPVAMAVDAAGNAYITGATTSLDFPTANPIQPGNHGGQYGDAFISKINSDGTELIYSTYLGGTDSDVGQSIAADPAGNVYVTGFTRSADFPTVNAFQPSLQAWNNGFVTKINGAGDTLVYSTYLGGHGGETYGWGIAVDRFGNAYVAGDTRSYDFPVVLAIQPTLHARSYFNSFLSKFNAQGSALLFSTYWGGSCGEGGSRVAADSAGNAYLGGHTCSTDFPTVNPIQPTMKGTGDAYVTKFNADGQSIFYSTFLGGSGGENGWDITVDLAGNAYLVGYTDSVDFPTSNAIQPTFGGGTDAYVAKINAAGNALVYSTYLGGSGDDHATGVAVDATGDAYIAGYESSADFPVVNPIQATNHGGRDAFLAKIAPDGSQLLYSTYLGGSADEGEGRDVSVGVDSNGAAYVAGRTASVDFPITPQAFQQSAKGGLETFVAKVVQGAVTATTLTSSRNPSNYGQAVTFTATVTSGSGTPTGTVIFYDGSSQLSSATLTNGNASFSTSTLSAGSHSITAAYQGSDVYAPSTSAPLIQVVNGTKTTTTLVSSLNPSVFGQSVIFTASVNSASGTPTGTVVFYDGSIQLGSATLASGSASFSTALLAAGSHSITAAYQGSGKFEPSTSAPLNQVVNSTTTTTSLESSANPAPVKQIVTYTATVISQYGGAATGTVAFQDGGITVATVTVSANQATYSTSYKKAGIHSMTASYSGDASNASSTSPVLLERIGKPLPTKTTLVTSGSPSYVGQAVTFTATVSATQGTIPDGELVTFSDGKTALGSVPLAGGTAQIVTSSLSAKTHTIKARYSGDPIFKPSMGLVKQVVNKYPTSTTLTSDPNPSNLGQPVTFTATVTTTGPYPLTGKVNFLDGTTSIGLVAVTNGSATLITSTLPVGSHSVTARYVSDPLNDKSTSEVLNQVVQ